jgi:hypothetical protein
VTAGAVLAVNNFGDTRSGGLAGPMALLIIVLLAIATVLLIRNMNARLRRLPDHFPGQESPGHDTPAQGSSGQDGPGEGSAEQKGPDRTGAGPA